ncbi:FIST N-terminal domain-containing protein [Thermoplasmatota archaeon]
MVEKKVETAVGMSRKWDAREAGKEVARSTIEKLDAPPDFFLLFSTIHYKKHGGFKEFLSGVWDVLPESTPLAGGTTAGFINNYGCYSRGATAMAVSYSNMDVVIGFGKNTKRNPKNAVKQSVNMIQEGLKNSEYKNKFLLNLISGPEIPSMPGLGRKKIIKSGLISKFAMQAFGISQSLLQKGVGREDEILEMMAKKLPDYHIVMGTLVDDERGLGNYQFLNDKILTNSTINLGIATDLNFDVCTTHGMKETDIKFEITKLSKNKRIVHQLNNKPAVPELCRLLGWPDDLLNDKTMYKTILYYPISLKRHGREVPVVMPFILKNSIMMPCIVDEGISSTLTMSGNSLLRAMEKNLSYFGNIRPEFGVISSCTTILETLGLNMHSVRDSMLNYFKEKPFIMFVCAGEGSYSPTKNITYANMSFNTAVFGHNY